MLLIRFGTFLAVFMSVAAISKVGKRAEKYRQLLERVSRFDVMHDECGIDQEARQECGKRTYQRGECLSRGCCFVECPGCDASIPWCFYAKRMVREECQVAYKDKEDCGYYGITEGECVFMRDCCWAPSGLPNDPPCFTKKYNRVRLEGGTMSDTVKSGRVEVFHDNEWGTVCDDNFDENAARVVCRSLGYQYSLARNYAVYGEGNGPIYLDGFYCKGDEENIEECSNIKWKFHDCSHSEDAGVVCSSEEIDTSTNEADSGSQYPTYPDYSTYPNYTDYIDPVIDYQGTDNSSEYSDNDWYKMNTGGKGKKGRAKNTPSKTEKKQARSMPFKLAIRSLHGKDKMAKRSTKDRWA